MLHKRKDLVLEDDARDSSIFRVKSCEGGGLRLAPLFIDKSKC